MQWHFAHELKRSKFIKVSVEVTERDFLHACWVFLHAPTLIAPGCWRCIILNLPVDELTLNKLEKFHIRNSQLPTGSTWCIPWTVSRDMTRLAATEALSTQSLLIIRAERESCLSIITSLSCIRAVSLQEQHRSQDLVQARAIDDRSIAHIQHAKFTAVVRTIAWCICVTPNLPCFIKHAVDIINCSSTTLAHNLHLQFVSPNRVCKSLKNRHKPTVPIMLTNAIYSPRPPASFDAIRNARWQRSVA